MAKILYQIENGKSGRRVIYKGFDKYEWSPGSGEDGTFFKEEEIPFILKIIGGLDYEMFIVRYKINHFNEWPITTKETTEKIEDLLQLDI